MDLQITNRAVAKLRETAQKEQINLAETMLRVAVVPGGCSGLTYALGWDTTRQEQDRVCTLDDLCVVMDLKSFLYLEGSELDFTDGLDGKGFHFLNPQATRTCACGESFGV
jgi:iron-sulfur cluster assembly protein